MAFGLLERIVGFFYGLDEAGNALLGGRPQETMSGSIGRACDAGKLWAIWAAAPVVDALAYVIARQKNHCRVTAQNEQKRRDALAAVGSAK